MAKIWQYQSNHKNYEVRSAGNSVRLYTEGVFHSQWNSMKPLSGSIWDLLFLPVLLRKPSQIKRVLVLGVGGGAVIKMINHFLQPEIVIGVDLDPLHNQIAKTYFGCDDENTQLITEDAQIFMRDYKGEPFDFIVDDIFTETQGEPVRAIPANREWCLGLLNHLSQTGIIAMNFATAHEQAQCDFRRRNSPLAEMCSNQLLLTVPLYDNRILAVSREGLKVERLTAQLEKLATQDTHCRNKIDEYQYRQL